MPLRRVTRVVTAGSETRYLAAPPGGRGVFPAGSPPGRALGPWAAVTPGAALPQQRRASLRRPGTRRRAGPGPRYNRHYKGGANAAPPRAAGPGRRYQLRAARPRGLPGDQRSPAHPIPTPGAD